MEFFYYTSGTLRAVYATRSVELTRCPVDSFEGFGSHWWRGNRFGRSKLKISRVYTLENPKWSNPAPDWDFGKILVYFLENLHFAVLVVVGNP